MSGRRCSSWLRAGLRRLSGWLGLSFHVVGRVDRVDWDEVAELVDASYRLTAPAGLVEELDARA